MIVNNGCSHNQKVKDLMAVEPNVALAGQEPLGDPVGNLILKISFGLAYRLRVGLNVI